MTDIWNEKPKINPGTIIPRAGYSARPMDIWLEMVKAEYEAMKAQITLLKLDIEALDKENRILQSIGDTPT